MVQAISGIAASQGDSGSPELVQTILPDKLAAMAVVQGVLAALLQRERTGRGRHLQVSMLDVAVSFLWPEAMRGLTFADADGPGHGGGRALRTSAVVRAGDGHWLAFTVPSDADWEGLCEVAERPGLFERYRSLGRRAVGIDAIADELTEAFAARARDEVVAELRARGVPCGPLHELDAVIADPQVRHNGVVREVDHPVLGTVREVASPVPVDPPGQRRWVGPAPGLGEHTDQVLAELGWDQAAIAGLRARGAVG